MTKKDALPELTDTVSIHYQKFFNRFAEIETLPVPEWKSIHILAFICKRYEQHYGMKYSFKFDSPIPSKSYEIYQVTKLANQISSQPQILKDYIDWFFTTKIIEKKKRITSLGLLTHTDIVNEFKFKFLFSKKEISRADKLPSNIANACTRHGFEIKTYAELAFIKKMPNQERLFEELKSLNFEVDLLDKIA